MVAAGGELFGLKLLLTLKVNKNPDSNIQLGNILQLYERNIYFFTKLFRVYIAPFIMNPRLNSDLSAEILNRFLILKNDEN